MQWEIVVLCVLAVGILVLAWQRGRWKQANPFVMLYHESGVPHQRGMIVAVHYDRKRFATLDAALAFGAGLIARGYAEIHVVRESGAERAGFSATVVDEDRFAEGSKRYRVDVNGPLGMDFEAVAQRLTQRPRDAR